MSVRTLYLHGWLKDKFGEKHSFDASTPRILFSAMRSQVPGFYNAVVEEQFVVVRGDRYKGYNLGAEELSFKFGNEKDLHLIPVVEGAKGKGAAVAKIVIGVALFAVGAFAIAAAPIGLAGATASMGVGGSALLGSFGLTYGALAVGGLGMALLGVSALLTPRAETVDYGDKELSDQRPSFLFNGPRNQSQQGLPIPLVFGRVRTGSLLVSTGITTEDLL